MNKAIEVSSETAVRIAEQAKLVGLSVDDYLKSLMPNGNGDRTETSSKKTAQSDGRAKAFRAWIEGQNSDAPPISLETLRRENLY